MPIGWTPMSSTPSAAPCAESAPQRAQQIKIERTLGALEHGFGVRQDLRTCGKAFHRNEVFSTADAQSDAVKRHLHPKEGVFDQRIASRRSVPFDRFFAACPRLDTARPNHVARPCSER